ncbi:MAG: cytochrome o ubiquinol oxidase subunit IV [Candidatus Saccharibacteria bacterium]
MSKSSHQATVGSYVSGFILSIIFTIIPYYVVVNKNISGNQLLAIIIGFAIVQVFIQVFFFLHLGRGPKPLYNVAFFSATLCAILLVVGGSLFIMSHLHYNMDSLETAKQLAESEAISQVEGNKTGACQAIKVNHKIAIMHTQISPTITEARQCDTLSFINSDSVNLKINFGTPTKSETYAGQTELSMRKGLSDTITLNQTGTYHFYDPTNLSSTGSFNVQP